MRCEEGVGEEEMEKNKKGRDDWRRRNGKKNGKKRKKMERKGKLTESKVI